MDSRTLLALCGLIVSSSYLSLTYDESYAFDRPIHTSTAVLAVAGIILIGWNKVGRLIWRGKPKPQEYTVLPLEELHSEPPSPRSPRPRSPLPRTPGSPASPRFANGNGFLKSPKAKVELAPPPSLKRLRMTWLLLVVAICCRVKLLHWIARESQCAGISYVWAIPLIISINDFWMVRRHEQPHGQEGASPSRLALMQNRITKSRYRYLLPTICFTIGSAMIVAATDPPRSTYICADVFNYRGIVPFSQILATVLDCSVILSVVGLINRSKLSQAQETKSYSSVGWAFTFSSIILAVSGVLFVVFRPGYRHWAFSISFSYVRSLCAFSSAAVLSVLCALYALDGVGALTTSVIVAFVCTYSRDLDWAWINRGPYPPTSTTLVLFSICLYILSTFWYTRIETHTEEYHSARSSKQRSAPSRLPGWMSSTIIFFLILRLFLALSKATQLSSHPIDELINNADSIHQTWQKKATAATSLDEALSQYRKRYHRPAPPMFDHWFESAKNKKSLIMNDFDQIHDDLVPFWSIDPQEIRQQTWDLVVNPANDVGGISIRGGHASTISNIPSDRKRTLDGLVSMINHFAQFLPDMDLAINVIDSPRIAVPYRTLKAMRDAGLRNADDRNNKDKSFSGGRDGQWQTISDDLVENSPIFEDHSGQQVFTEWGSTSCPTMSSSRLQGNWDRGRLCTSCTARHSDESGAFVSNWTLAQNPCHQPDLASLHGLYTSPPSFRVHHSLLPVFSHSKVQGFQDILYPSVEGYAPSGDAVYAPTEEHPDPPFSDKDPTLFFRGASSEGISTGNNAWRSFLRQRFLHLLSPGAHAGVTSPMLLPARNSESFKFVSIPDNVLRTLLPTDAKFTEIANCVEADCSLERAQFESTGAAATSPAISFQDFWRYKYLLDLDGVGHNARFPTFLRSHSLVFKAGILREWWSSRVTAWKHFVPLDVRGHNLFPTLAYFRGFPATKRTSELPAHEEAAQRIAEDGKRWAEKVMRKEDMEIYMFRLLLEWGRVTDDRRDSIGFGAEEKWWEGTHVGVGQGRGDKKKSTLAKLVGG